MGLSRSKLTDRFRSENSIGTVYTEYEGGIALAPVPIKDVDGKYSRGLIVCLQKKWCSKDVAKIGRKMSNGLVCQGKRIIKVQREGKTILWPRSH